MKFGKNDYLIRTYNNICVKNRLNRINTSLSPFIPNIQVKFFERFYTTYSGQCARYFNEIQRVCFYYNMYTFVPYPSIKLNTFAKFFDIPTPESI